MPPRQKRTSSRQNQPESNVLHQHTPEGMPQTLNESQEFPHQEPSVQGGPGPILEPVQEIPAELAEAGIADALPEHVTQAFVTILQQKNQVIADREALLSRYERGSVSARPRASKQGDQRPDRPDRRTPQRTQAPPRRSITRRDPPRRISSHRSPPRRNARNRRSPREEKDNAYASSDRSSASHTDESADSRRSRSRSWDSYEEFEGPGVNQCRRHLTERPQTRSSSDNRPQRPVTERLGMPASSGHFGVPINLAMPPYGNDQTPTGQGPFTRDIRRYRIPRDLRKPPNLNKFDGRGDPDKHLRYFNNYCSYRELGSTMKCRLFPQSLDGRALEWWETLRPNTIPSWEGLVATFLANYTANRCQYRYEEHLDTIVQGENESLRRYIDRFNSEADTVRDLSDRDKLKYLKRGIREDHRFAEEFTLNHYHDLGMFLRRANDHMAYEERLAAKKGARARPREEQNRSGREQQSKRDRPGRGQEIHHEYRPDKCEQRTMLNTPIAQIYTECQDSEFAGVQRPDPLVLKKGSTKKYCRYHKSAGHDTNNCMALKGDIEDLIQKGKLRQYVRAEANGRPEEAAGGHPTQNEGKARASADQDRDNATEDHDNRRSRGRRVAL